MVAQLERTGYAGGNEPMTTSRRDFIAVIAAAFVVDPERMLWVPGKKLISIPESPGHYLTVQEITSGMLAILCNNIDLGIRQLYDDQFSASGNLIRVRKPLRLNVPSLSQA